MFSPNRWFLLYPSFSLNPYIFINIASYHDNRAIQDQIHAQPMGRFGPPLVPNCRLISAFFTRKLENCVSLCRTGVFSDHKSGTFSGVLSISSFFSYTFRLRSSFFNIFFVPVLMLRAVDRVQWLVSIWESGALVLLTACRMLFTVHYSLTPIPCHPTLA